MATERVSVKMALALCSSPSFVSAKCFERGGRLVAPGGTLLVIGHSIAKGGRRDKPCKPYKPYKRMY